MIFEEDTNIPIQVYVKEACGIQYLKTIGIFRKETGDAFFNWQDLSEHAEIPMSRADHMELYMNGKRAYLTSWAEHMFTDSKRVMVLKDAHFVS